MFYVCIQPFGLRQTCRCIYVAKSVLYMKQGMNYFKLYPRSHVFVALKRINDTLLMPELLYK